MGFFRKAWDLDTPLLQFSPCDPWTIADACEGTQIFGATGSGKTSGSGAAIARAFLRAGFGGLILVCKEQDGVETWKKYAAETGRSRDLVIFGPKNQHRFNFLDWEIAQGGDTENIVKMFQVLMEVGKGSQSSRENEDYWQRGANQLVRCAVDILRVAGEKITIDSIHRYIASGATSPEQMSDPKWVQSSYHLACILKASEKLKSGRVDPVLAHDANVAGDFWGLEYPNMDARPRSSVVSTWSVMADTFMHGFAHQLLGTTTNLNPEAVFGGKIIILDLPLKRYGAAARLPQIAWKYCFQVACERRDVRKLPRPVFLWVDESVYFITSEQDILFQATARASRCCTVFLTQSVASYYSQLGGESRRSGVDSLLGNLQTKIFHANGEATTNHYASDLIGQTRQFFLTSNTSARQGWMGGAGGNPNISGGTHEQEAAQISPIEFTKLRKGGKANKGQVDAIVFQGGRTFKANGKNYLRVTFKQ